MRKLFLSLVFLSVLLSIQANPGIKGIVSDQTTRKALDYAHVVLYDGDHIVEEAMTEANGSFLIQPVKPGTYSIRIHFLGYDVYMGEEFILTEQIKDLGIIPMQMLEVGLQEMITGAEALMRALKEENVKTIFGYHFLCQIGKAHV